MTLYQIANLIEVRNGLPFAGIGARSRFRVMVDSRRLFALCAWRRGHRVKAIAEEIKVGARQTANLIQSSLDRIQSDREFALAVREVESAITAREGEDSKQSTDSETKTLARKMRSEPEAQSGTICLDVTDKAQGLPGKQCTPATNA